MNLEESVWMEEAIALSDSEEGLQYFYRGDPHDRRERYRTHRRIEHIRDFTKAVDIAQAVAQRFNFTLEKLQSRPKYGRLAIARGLAMYFVRKLTDLSYPEIGALLKRDHSTIVIRCQQIAARAERDPGFARTLAEIGKAVGQ
jgi:chromosomal replication initiation ATPase DnaA